MAGGKHQQVSIPGRTYRNKRYVYDPVRGKRQQLNELSKLLPEYPGSVMEAISGDRKL